MPDATGDQELPYGDFLEFIKDLSEPIPEGNAALRILLDAMIVTIADLDFIPLPLRTTENFVVGVEVRSLSRVQQAHLESSTLPTETEELALALGRTVLRYRHQRLLEMGRPFPRCSLEPPCQFHPRP